MEQKVKNCEIHGEGVQFIAFADGEYKYCLACAGIAVGKFLKLENLNLRKYKDGSPKRDHNGDEFEAGPVMKPETLKEPETLQEKNK